MDRCIFLALKRYAIRWNRDRIISGLYTVEMRAMNESRCKFWNRGYGNTERKFRELDVVEVRLINRLMPSS